MAYCLYYRSPDKSHDKSHDKSTVLSSSNNLSEIKEEDEQKDEGVQVVVVEPAATSEAPSKETNPQMDGQAGSQNHDSETAAVSKEDAPATSSTNEERTDDSVTKNGPPAVEEDNIQRTDSGPPEDEVGSVQRSRTDSGPPPSEGDTITSFSSVKHLLS